MSRNDLSTSAGHEVSGARRRLPLGTVLAIVFGGAAVLAVLDQITKNWAEATLPLLEPQPLLGEIVQLTLLYNSGAAWGMGAEITPVVTGLQILIALGVIVFATTSVRSAGYATALAMVLGGALGNIHDRLLRPPGPFRGEVVDFLQLPNWPVFNVADMAVVGGAVLVVLLGLFGRSADPAATDGVGRRAGPAASDGVGRTADPAAAEHGDVGERSATDSDDGGTPSAPTHRAQRRSGRRSAHSDRIEQP